MISGSNFVGVSSVTCTVAGKTAPVASYTVVSPASIAAILPQGVQTGNFIVANSKGTSAGFRYEVGA